MAIPDAVLLACIGGLFTTQIALIVYIFRQLTRRVEALYTCLAIHASSVNALSVAAEKRFTALEVQAHERFETLKDLLCRP